MKKTDTKIGASIGVETGFACYLSVVDVARILRRSPRTIRDWILTGCPTPKGRIRLDAVKLGRSWTVHPDWLALFEYRVRPAVARAVLDIQEGEQDPVTDRR